MAGGLGEPAGERESFLGGGGAAATTVSPASDPERETMPLGGGNSNSSSAANMRPRRRWKEDGLAEPLEESPNGARGERNRSESTTPGSRTRSTFESKTGTTASRGGLVSFPRLLSYLEACLRGPETTRISLAVLAVATLLSLTMAVGASVGLWSWSDIFPRKAYLFDVVRDCRKVRTGRGAPCSNVFESACFDRSRCAAADGGRAGGGGGTSLSVYVHDDKCSMKSSSEIVANYRGGAVPQMWSQAAEALRQVAASRELLVETPEQACIIVYGVPHEKECVSRTPTWGEGRNHLLLDMNDASRDAYPTLDDKAMFAESNMRPCYFRYGYDIALPLRARAFFYNLRGIAPQDRKYFATFKGSLYLSGNGLRERAAVRTVADTAADPTGVVVVEMCDRFHGEPERPRNVKLCQRLRRDYDKADYADLMNTTFALVPAGRSPATYRLGEALSAGAIPVFIHQDFVKPFPGRIPWHTFSFSFPAEEAPRIIDTLRTVSPRKLAKMQETALEVFDKFFGRGMNGIVGTTLDILEERLSFRGQRR